MSAADNEMGSAWSFSTKAALAAVLTVWFALAAVAGTSGLFTAGPDQVFRPVLLSVVVPVAVFLGVFAASPAFRSFVMSWDIRFLTMLQLWRVVGFAFLPLYAFDVLPGLFSWPAGLGDVAVGVTAPLVVLALLRKPEFARSGRFIVWNLLGLLDFVGAAGTAMLASGAIPGLVAGTVTSGPMEVWPLSLFPSFIVPLFVFMHLSVLFQVRALRAQAGGTRRANSPIGADVPGVGHGPLAVSPASTRSAGG
jgi:hypothetical protein